jgi:hypothetical protein
MDRYKFASVFLFVILLLSSQLKSYGYSIVLKSTGKEIQGVLILEDKKVIKIKDSQGIELSFNKEKLDLEKMQTLNGSYLQTVNKRDTAATVIPTITLTRPAPQKQIKLPPLKTSRGALSKMEVDALMQKYQELTQSDDYKKKVSVANEEHAKEQKEAEELKEKKKAELKIRLSELQKEYNQLSEKYDIVDPMCAPSTTDGIVINDDGSTGYVHSKTWNDGACGARHGLLIKMEKISKEVEEIVWELKN